ncbi:archaeal/vacuolar-type H+-ATPase subunit A [Microbacterium testaceum StLB037]|uniref:Archaeal/vacuolar-type H+-ATPase subunit A n=1 Tax=Microbacterium testaceum (strain StLB037) TaxID=979556 RepID=E8NGK1_MICTS|nr:hypothetical protein [Microbacterium testaceum]BAJ74084.1 archaeal/vacuolar-type H+-ATPase subunit A [Microbacterium testaceum StLB037]
MTTRARIGIAAAVLGTVAVGGAAVVMFGWMIDETRFDRPDPAFDALASEIAAVPGVTDVQKQRWVEAPAFLATSSWVQVTAEASAFPEVREIACETTYPDAVEWGFDLESAGGTRVSAFADAARGCPAFGFDLEPVASEIFRVAPGSVIQAAIWDAERFALSSLDGGASEVVAHLLPLVAHADTLREAAGVDPAMPVEVSGPRLGVEIGPGEAAGYHALLTTLIGDHDVSFFSFGGGGTPIDGVEKVQVTAPDAQHAAIERLIADSGLPVADLPVAFLE